MSNPNYDDRLEHWDDKLARRQEDERVSLAASQPRRRPAPPPPTVDAATLETELRRAVGAAARAALDPRYRNWANRWLADQDQPEGELAWAFDRAYQLRMSGYSPLEASVMFHAVAAVHARDHDDKPALAHYYAVEAADSARRLGL